MASRMIVLGRLLLPLTAALMLANACKSVSNTGTSTLNAVSPDASTTSVSFNPLGLPVATATNIYAFAPGFKRDALSFPSVVAAAIAQNQDVGLLQNFLAQIESVTGVKIESSVVEQQLKSAPEHVTDLLQIPLSVMEAGINVINTVRSRDKSPRVYSYQLPLNFDWANGGQNVMKITDAGLQPSFAGTLAGWPNDPDLPVDAAQRNSLLAEVVERLAYNRNLGAGDRFTLTYNGKSYTDLAGFLTALRANGHTITARVHHTVADFAGLHAKGPDGAIHEVAAPIFIRTGFTDESGAEAVMPALHSEIIFDFAPSQSTQGGTVTASISFYQGTDRTGFYCSGCTKRADWAGSKFSDQFSAAESQTALVLAGYFMNVIREIALDNKLSADDAYGATGVCNDSVGIIQLATVGRVYPYVLLASPDLMLPKLNQHIATASSSGQNDDLTAYQALKTAVTNLPLDVQSPDDAKQRALTAIPWTAGSETFISTVQARAILGGK